MGKKGFPLTTNSRFFPISTFLIGSKGFWAVADTPNDAIAITINNLLSFIRLEDVLLK